MIRFSRGSLKEETHYYPHGLPIAGMGSAAAGFKENKKRYQSNEYKKDLGLNWMDFNFRQYDPQIGRFLSVDPLASSTLTMSPYAAMNNNPVSLTDPDGLRVDVLEHMSERDAYINPLGPPEWMDAEMAGIIGYLASGRMGGMNWDGGSSFGANNAWADQIMKSFQEFMGAGRRISGGIASNLGGSNGNTIFGYRALFIYESETPEIYANTVSVLKDNPDWFVLTYNGGGEARDKNRKDALSGKGGSKAGPGRSWDEFPYAMTKEGGIVSYVFSVSTKEQQIQAGQLGAMVTRGGRMKAGEKFFVIPIKDQRTKEPVPVPLKREKPSNFPTFPIIPFLERRLVPMPIIIPSIMPFINPNYEPQGEGGNM